MSSSSDRETLFADGRGQARRRQLRLTLLVVSAALVATSIATALPVPNAVHHVAAVAALLAVGSAWLAIRALGEDDFRRRRDIEATIELAGSMLVAVDRECRIRMVNPVACDVLGRSRDDLLGTELQSVFDPSEAEASRAAFRRILAGTVDSTGMRRVRPILRPDGAVRAVNWHVAPRCDDAGRVVGLLLSAEDVTAEQERERLIRRDQTDLEQLRALAQDVAARDDARHAVTARVRRLLDADLVAFAEPDETGAVTYTAATDPELVGIILPADERSIARTAIAEGAPVHAVDAARDERVNAELVARLGVTTMRAEPIHSAAGVVGVLVVGWKLATPALDGRREQLLALAADEAAIALQRVATLRHLRRVALTDALTGIPNRRAFDQELDRAIARAGRSGAPLTLAVMDLNEFKALNDRHGHDAGDALLAGCAGYWEAELRAGDMLARLGGDEFAAILPDCDERDARAIVERLRTVTPHRSGSGIGFATWQGESRFELYQLADRALYADKAQHRAARIADPARAAAVVATGLTDGGSSDAIEAIAADARELLGIEGIYVNLVGADWLTHVSGPVGTPAGMPTSESYCQHVVTSGQPFIVEDAREIAALSGNPNVAAGAIAYAGMPLADEAGNVVGALCAADSEPRAWSAAELRVLDRLALRVARELSASSVT